MPPKGRPRKKLRSSPKQIPEADLTLQCGQEDLSTLPSAAAPTAANNAVPKIDKKVAETGKRVQKPRNHNTKKGVKRRRTVSAAAAAVAADAAETQTTQLLQTVAPQPQPPKAARKEAVASAAAAAVVSKPQITTRTPKSMGGAPGTSIGALAEDSPPPQALLHRLLSPFSASSLHVADPPNAVVDAAAEPAWSTSDVLAVSTFLAQVQCHLTRHFCQQLSRLTTGTSTAFLHATALGEEALKSHDVVTDTEVTAAAVSSSMNASDEELNRAAAVGAVPHVEQLLDRQEQAYRTIRATIAASCTLGHRSCQVLWGPNGSGKHRILRLLAREVRQTPNTLVLELHGLLLRDDEAALGVIAQQLLAFLQSPQSLPLREANWMLRTGSFGFGQLFHFERRLQAVWDAGEGAADEGKGQRNDRQRNVDDDARLEDASGHDEEDLLDEDDGDASSDGDLMVTSTTTYLTGGAASALPHLQRAFLLLKAMGCSIVVCIRDIDVFGIRCDQLLYVLSGLMHDSEGSNGGGGLSLVLASAAPDIRQLEKRLSSRLTCETRYVPLLPWSLLHLCAATVHVTGQDAFFQVRMWEMRQRRTAVAAMLSDGAIQLRRNREEGLLRKGTAAARAAATEAEAALQLAMATWERQLQQTGAALRELRARQLHLHARLGGADAISSLATGGGAVAAETADGAAPSSSTPAYVCASRWRSSSPSTAQLTRPTNPLQTTVKETPYLSNFGAAGSWSVEALEAHASLTLEVQGVMCEELIRQLRAISRVSPAEQRKQQMRLVSHVHAVPLAKRVCLLDSELELNSSTGPTVLTALTSTLCKTASGAVDLLGAAGRQGLLRWLRARLQHEAIPVCQPNGKGGTSAANALHATVSSHLSACPVGLPEKILVPWRESAESLVPSASGNAANARHGTDDAALSTTIASLPPLSLLPPHLFDLLAEGHLVGMGYGSRELMLLLFYMYLHHTIGVTQRTVADLLEDVSSSLGTKAAAALDREAFRYAIRLLCRWRVLRVVERHSQLLELCGSAARLREFLTTTLAKQPAWCEAELGLDARDIMRFRNLV